MLKRLDRPETWLKALIATVLLLVGLYAGYFTWAHIRSVRDAALTKATAEIDLLASLAALEYGRIGQAEPRPAQLQRVIRAIPASVLAQGRTILLADAQAKVVAGSPSTAAVAATLTDLFGEGQPLTFFADRAGVMSVHLGDGSEVLATIRGVSDGSIVVFQPLAAILSETRTRFVGEFGVLAALLLAAGSLGAVCRRQMRRVCDASNDSERVRRRLNTSLSRGRCGLWDWDLARGRMVWSDSMYDLLGYERREDGLSFGEVDALMHPDDLDLYRLAQDLASERACQIDHEFRMRSASGGWVWLRTRAEMVLEPSDGSRHLVGIAVDVTDERGRVEQNVEADLRLRDAIEAISEAFVLWDADNRLVLCNSKFRALHDLPRDAVLPGMSYQEIVEAGRPPVVEHQLSRQGPDESGARTLEAQLSDGRWLHINERRTKDGGFVSVGTDISNLKQNESKLLESESRLLRTVSDLRTSRETLQVQAQQLAELAERYLEQKADAETANQAKTEFLAKMSHELRTPLNAVIGFAEIMQTEMFGPLGSARYAEYCKDIHASGHYLLSVINDILDMSKIEAGRMELTAAPLELDEAVGRAVGIMSEQARVKGLDLTVSATPGLIVPADGRALHQILLNVLQNAIKFTPAGGAINVRVREAGAAINIFVEDTGIGIPAAALAKVGKPFEQVENEFNRSHKGSGLGLAIARSLAELHGGGLRIRSQPGSGTVVLVHLPRPSATSGSEEPATLRSNAA
ncbi:MAG TPA: ATP-binding protein [Enterovirga sp.]|nr:ATP-binding protein [Enterovirga sp.]